MLWRDCLFEKNAAIEGKLIGSPETTCENIRLNLTMVHNFVCHHFLKNIICKYLKSITLQTKVFTTFIIA